MIRRILFLFALWAGATLLFAGEPGVEKRQNLWDDKGVKLLYHGRRDSKSIALTIDDGWVPDYELIDYLYSQDVACTVFIPGKIVTHRPEWISYMADRGFEICGHGYSHRLFPFLTPEEQKRELDETAYRISEITGKTPPYMRPSGGRLDGPFPSLDLIREAGYTVVLWENDVRGYNSGEGVEEQLEWLWDHLQPGNIILSHFGDSLHTREVLEKWIPQVKARGYHFVTVSQLAGEMK